MKYISKNIRHLRKLRRLTQEQLADKLGIHRSRIGSYEEARSEPSIETLIGFSNYFNLPVDILIRKDLTYSDEYSHIDVGNQRVLFPIMVNEENENLIEIVPIEASAGYLNGYDDPEYIEQLQRFKLPFLPTGKHRAFPIKGDSMLPTPNGAFVVCEFVEDINNLKNGTACILVSRNDGITYKRITKQVKNNSLLLTPDNKEFKPYELPLEEILEIWEYKCTINNQDIDKRNLNLNGVLNLFNELKIELERIQKVVG
ncbi:XRE family transcriptional regulator [Polaribacter septentrionalilitoris]|uniref:XRE family transcriptional regulator n=1 Tax=Polaribacter septentrionalilitoris TaxID=2494657 RepID=UPI00135A4495|nr:XRE family transcriptional regulator [Polaribacter septentrionalilitoris]